MGSKGEWVTKRAQPIHCHWHVYTYTEVCWAGSGGYWNYVQPTDLVEFDALPEEAQAAVHKAQDAKAKWR